MLEIISYFLLIDKDITQLIAEKEFQKNFILIFKTNLKYLAYLHVVGPLKKIFSPLTTPLMRPIEISNLKFRQLFLALKIV